MGTMIIGLFLAIVIGKIVGKKFPGFATTLVTLVLVLALIFGLLYPFSYESPKVLESKTLIPIEGDDVYLQIIDDTYFYFKTTSEKGVTIEKPLNSNYQDVKIQNSYSYRINYCVEYPKSSFMSYALIKFPHNYVEFLVPEDGVTEIKSDS